VARRDAAMTSMTTITRTASRMATSRQLDVAAAYVPAGGPVPEAAALAGTQPRTAKQYFTGLRAKSALTTVELDDSLGYPAVLNRSVSGYRRAFLRWAMANIGARTARPSSTTKAMSIP
jgi:hypothetical protein